jgi:hypothetical protein
MSNNIRFKFHDKGNDVFCYTAEEAIKLAKKGYCLQNPTFRSCPNTQRLTFHFIEYEQERRVLYLDNLTRKWSVDLISWDDDPFHAIIKAYAKKYLYFLEVDQEQDAHYWGAFVSIEDDLSPKAAKPVWLQKIERFDVLKLYQNQNANKSVSTTIWVPASAGEGELKATEIVDVQNLNTFLGTEPPHEVLLVAHSFDSLLNKALRNLELNNDNASASTISRLQQFDFPQ